MIFRIIIKSLHVFLNDKCVCDLIRIICVVSERQIDWVVMQAALSVFCKKRKSLFEA